MPASVIAASQLDQADSAAVLAPAVASAVLLCKAWALLLPTLAP